MWESGVWTRKIKVASSRHEGMHGDKTRGKIPTKIKYAVRNKKLSRFFVFLSWPMDGLYGKGFFYFFAPCGKVEAKVDRKHYQNPQTKIDYFYLAALLDLATGVGDRASSPCMQFCVLRNPSLPPSILANSTTTLIKIVSPVFCFKLTFHFFFAVRLGRGRVYFSKPPPPLSLPCEKGKFSFPPSSVCCVGGR